MIGFAVGALAVCLAGLIVAYSRMLPAAPRAASLALSVGCALAASAVWLTAAALGAPVPPQLLPPIAGLAALAGFLVALPLRAGGAAPLRALGCSTVWTALVFVPAAVLGFGGRELGLAAFAPIDHAGALSLHVAAGAAVAGALLMRPAGGAAPRPIPGPVAVAALAAIMTGWLGWLVAAELRVGEVSVLILVNGAVAALGAAGGWSGVQRIRGLRLSAGAVTAGVLAGLIAVSAGAPLLTPVSAAASGVFAGALAAWLTLARVSATSRVLWFVVGSHLVAGVVGMVFLGLLGNDLGYIFTGQTEFILGQLGSSAAVALWSAAVAAGLAVALLRARR